MDTGIQEAFSIDTRRECRDMNQVGIAGLMFGMDIMGMKGLFLRLCYMGERSAFLHKISEIVDASSVVVHLITLTLQPSSQLSVDWIAS